MGRSVVVNVAKEVDHRPESTLPLYDAADLTKRGDLAQIRLGDSVYTLRITRSGKLILTK